MNRMFDFGRKNLSLALFLGAVSITLSGCSLINSSPEDVLAKANVSIGKLTSFTYKVDLSLAGFLPSQFTSQIDQARIQFAGASVNSENRPAFTLDGRLVADALEGQVRVDGSIIALSDYTYFRINDLSLPSLAPTPTGAIRHWYKIKQPVPSDQKNVLGIASTGNALAADQIQAVRDLLAETNALLLDTVFPDTTLFGTRVHHYRVRLNPDVLPELASELATILHQKKLSVEQLKLAENYRAEIWLDRRNQNLVQLKLADVYLTDSRPTYFDLTLNLDRHNQRFSIQAPISPEELNPNNLWPVE